MFEPLKIAILFFIYFLIFANQILLQNLSMKCNTDLMSHSYPVRMDI